MIEAVGEERQAGWSHERFSNYTPDRATRTVLAASFSADFALVCNGWSTLVRRADRHRKIDVPFSHEESGNARITVRTATRQANIRIGDTITTIVVRARCESHRQAGHAECVSSWVDARAKEMKKVYAEKPTDKRPVWVIKPDSTDPHVIESLRFQCAMDGGRAAWKPIEE